ncbi:hypothetical protein [Brassicibacter mesophilus]|uniref:hypothetical protein n=1 Tax=Brassicibacter mesophilus TaxID=745119 RepID=UPI003D240C14
MKNNKNLIENLGFEIKELKRELEENKEDSERILLDIYVKEEAVKKLLRGKSARISGKLKKADKKEILRYEILKHVMENIDSISEEDEVKYKNIFLEAEREVGIANNTGCITVSSKTLEFLGDRFISFEMKVNLLGYDYSIYGLERLLKDMKENRLKEYIIYTFYGHDIYFFYSLNKEDYNKIKENYKDYLRTLKKLKRKAC